MSIPGTGLSHTKKLGAKGQRVTETEAEEVVEATTEPAKSLDLLGTFAIIVGFFGGALSLVPISIGSVVIGVLGLVAGTFVTAWGVVRVLEKADPITEREIDEHEPSA